MCADLGWNITEPEAKRRIVVRYLRLVNAFGPMQIAVRFALYYVTEKHRAVEIRDLQNSEVMHCSICSDLVKRMHSLSQML